MHSGFAVELYLAARWMLPARRCIGEARGSERQLLLGSCQGIQFKSLE